MALNLAVGDFERNGEIEQTCNLGNIRRAVQFGEHTQSAANCIPPAEVALNLEFGDFERNGYIHGHWGGVRVSSEENESE